MVVVVVVYLGVMNRRPPTRFLHLWHLVPGPSPCHVPRRAGALGKQLELRPGQGPRGCRLPRWRILSGDRAAEPPAGTAAGSPQGRKGRASFVLAKFASQGPRRTLSWVSSPALPDTGETSRWRGGVPSCAGGGVSRWSSLPFRPVPWLGHVTVCASVGPCHWLSSTGLAFKWQRRPSLQRPELLTPGTRLRAVGAQRPETRLAFFPGRGRQWTARLWRGPVYEDVPLLRWSPAWRHLSGEVAAARGPKRRREGRGDRPGWHPRSASLWPAP